ncbi:MAG: prolyl oligopeptidase family serine peptidase [Anaeromyxobacteraceae bacterium]
MLAELLTLALVVAQSPAAAPAPTGPARLAYPPTRTVDVVDDYFGTKVKDPYRWLEDDNAADVKVWVEAQNALTNAYLAAIPERAAIRERMTQIWNFERFPSPPVRRGDRTFYVRNSGLQPQAVLHVTDDPAREGRVLLDPNAMSKDGTVALSGLGYSDDGRLLAYAIADAGSDWQIWRVRDVDTGKDLPDEVRWSKFSGASFSHDGKGFYYSRYPAPAEANKLTAVNLNHQVWYHAVGTSQDKDVLVWERPDQPEWNLGATVSDDGRWLVLRARRGTNPESAIFVQDLAKAGARPEPLLPRMDAAYEYVDSQGDTFLFLTDKGAPRRRLVAVSLAAPEEKDWKVIVPEGPGADVIRSASVVGNRLLVSWMRDVKSAVEVFDLAGKKVADLPLPGIGTATGFSGKRTDTETYFIFTGFLSPPTVYRLDAASLVATVFRQPRVDFDPSRFEVTQVFYPSKDGTRVPMFLLHRKGVVLDGRNPTLLYGYGGFNQSMLPAFTISRAVWLEMGGVYALANLRGGGEYGKAWYDAGRLGRKQNVFDDFIAAAEWLQKGGWTSPDRLAVNGGSNGGLLVGAVMTQRPDLFAVALPQVGVMDMLRFHKFTIGWAWRSDYGSSETKVGFDTLFAYSPLHRLRKGTAYPATLVTTADHDDRVVPAHSFKFIAELQADQGGPRPVLARIETRAGHGAGKPTQKAIEEAADVFAFTLKNLGMQLPAGFGGKK